MIGPLLTAIMRFSLAAVGTPISYLEMGNLTVTIRTEPKINVTCVVFFDAEDSSSEFAKMVADGILLKFLDEYSDYDWKGALDLKHFKDFHAHIPQALQNVIQPLLFKLQTFPAVQVASCITTDQKVLSTNQIEPIRLNATWGALSAATSAALAHCKDSPIGLTFVGNTKRLFVLSFQESALIVQCRKSHDPTKVIRLIEAIHYQLTKLFTLIDNISIST